MSRIEDRRFSELHMNAVTDIQSAAQLLSDIELLDRTRRNVPMGEARTRIARLLHVSPRTLEKIRTSKLKSIPAWLMARMRAELVSILQAEIRRLQHEVHVHQQIGTDHRDVDFAAAQAALAEARKIIEGTR